MWRGSESNEIVYIKFTLFVVEINSGVAWLGLAWLSSARYG